MKILKINTDCWFALLVLLFVLEILKKSSENEKKKALKMKKNKALKMTIQLVIFRAFFLFFFLSPQT